MNIYIDTADEVYINNISIEQILTNLFLYYSSEIKSLFFNNEPVEDRKKLNIISDDSIKRMKKITLKPCLQILYHKDTVPNFTQCEQHSVVNSS